MDIQFKAFKAEGLNNYLFVKQPDEILANGDMNINLHHYLLLASRLTAGLSCFVLTRYSPFLKEVLTEVQSTNWHYEVTADDFQGLGADLGFSLFHRSSNGNSIKEKSAFFPLKDLLTLRSFPEDTLGDKASQVSIFAIKTESDMPIKSFLISDQAPCLSELLGDSGLFIHISCSKCSGFYDAILIKSAQTLNNKAMVIA